MAILGYEIGDVEALLSILAILTGFGAWIWTKSRGTLRQTAQDLNTPLETERLAAQKPKKEAKLFKVTHQDRLVQGRRFAVEDIHQFDLPQSSGPVSVLVHEGSWCYGRGGRQSGSRWLNQP